MIAFTPSGNLASFTANSSAPTAVQSLGTTGVQTQQYKLDNTSSTVDAVVGWGASSDAAKAAAAAGADETNCMYLMRGTVQVVTAAPGTYFSGISASAVVVKVQSGYGN